MHGLFEVDGVEDFQFVALFQQQSAAFHDNAALGVCDYITGMALKEIRLYKKASFAAAGTTDYQHVLISRMSRILGAVAHHQAFGLSQDHILLKNGISEGLDVLGCTP